MSALRYLQSLAKPMIFASGMLVGLPSVWATSKLNWEGAIGLSVTPGGQCDGDEAISASNSHKLKDEGCDRVKLLVTVSGTVEKVDSGYDVVSVNGMIVFEGDETDLGNCETDGDLMTQKNGTVTIEVGPGEEITLSYSTNDGEYNAGAQAQITNIVEAPVQGGCDTCGGGGGSGGGSGGSGGSSGSGGSGGESSGGSSGGGTSTFAGNAWGSNSSGEAGFATGLGGTSSAYASASIYAEAKPTNALSGDRGGLSYVGPDETHVAERIFDSGNKLSQVKAKAGLVDLVDVSGGYEMHFYDANQVGSFDSGTGKYALSNSPKKVLSVIRHVSGSTSTVTYTETVGTSAPVVLWSNSINTSTNTHTSSEFGGNKVTVTTKTTLTSTKRKELVTVKSVIGITETVFSITESIYETFGWGEELVERSEDPSGANRRTVWTFYSNQSTDGNSYSLLKSQVGPNGDWVIYKNYNADGLPGKVVSQYNSNTIDYTSTGEAANWLETVSASQVDEDGDSVADVTKEKSRFLKGQLIGRTWETHFSKVEPKALSNVNFYGNAVKRHYESAHSVSATRGDTANPIVVEWYDSVSKQRIQRTSPEGVSSISYTSSVVSGGARIPRSYRGEGQLNSYGDLVSGWREERQEDQNGNAQTYVYDVNWGTLFYQYPSDLDSEGRAQRMTFYDGSYEEYVYGCCGLDEKRNRDGSRTVFLRDAMKRVNEEITYADGVFISAKVWEMDPLGRVRKTLRRSSATDNSPQVTSQIDYDLAGRLSETKDALNRVTSYSYSVDTNGRTVLTATYPGGGTNIETREKSGFLSTVGGSAVEPRLFVEDIDSNGWHTIEYRIGEGGAQSEWVRSDYDFLGRVWKKSYPYPTGTAAFFYFDKDGRIVKSVDADGVTRLSAYDSVGRIEYNAIDLNNDDAITLGGLDRVTRFAYDTEYLNGYTAPRVSTYVLLANNSTSERLVLQQTTKHEDGETIKVVNGSGTFLRSTQYRTHDCVVTDTSPDGRVTETVKAAGRKVEEVVKKGTTILSDISYHYDAFNRHWKVVDAALGTTEYLYYNDDQLQSVTTPDPDTTKAGVGFDALVTSYQYDSAGRLWKTTLPDNSVETRTYYPTGRIKLVYGGKDYPRESSYDTQGRIKTLTTWQNFNASTQTGTGAAETIWNYHPQRGWLENKRYQNNLGPSYTYTPAGRLEVRTWARLVSGLPLTTTYGYNDAGDIESIDYSDLTQDVALTYDREGRVETVTDAAGLLTRSYNANSYLDDEVYTGSGLLSGRSITRGFDGYLRPETLNTGSDYSVTWAYSSDDTRLDTITYGAHSAEYGYLPSTRAINSVTYRHNATVRGGMGYTHDNLLRVSRAEVAASGVSGGVATSRDYEHDEMGRRSRVEDEDGKYWNYGYDALGQVQSAIKKDSADTALPGYSYGFEFDSIGNRISADRGGKTDYYEADLLNQYSRIKTAGVIEVRGTAQAGLPIIVNDQLATRTGDAFYRATDVNNTGGARNVELKIQAVRQTPTTAVATETRATRIQADNLAPQYDEDGNPTNQGIWKYSWDAENRLIAAEISEGVSPAMADLPRLRLEFSYDSFGRRIGKIVKTWNSGAWVTAQERRYLYDGWNNILEFDQLNAGATVLRHVWGLDLSVSAQGAGGIGGLLFSEASAGVYTPGYDANGNIVVWVSMADGAVAGHWEYGAFGETISYSGVARSLPHAFSTKYRDVETGLYNYGYRSYDPTTGRFLGRDPIEERGGLNLYGMVGNNTINLVDPFGLSPCEVLLVIGHNTPARDAIDAFGKSSCSAVGAIACQEKGSSTVGGNFNQGLAGEGFSVIGGLGSVLPSYYRPAIGSDNFHQQTMDAGAHVPGGDGAAGLSFQRPDTIDPHRWSSADAVGRNRLLIQGIIQQALREAEKIAKDRKCICPDGITLIIKFVDGSESVGLGQENLQRNYGAYWNGYPNTSSENEIRITVPVRK